MTNTPTTGLGQRLAALLLRAPQLWLVLLCLLVLGRGLSGEFVMDDGPVIEDNSKIIAFKYIPDYFTGGVWHNTDYADQAKLSGNVLYRPLFLLTLNLGHHLWGASAVGFHALNLALHAINTLLVFYLIAGLFPAQGRLAALAGAAVFAVHPVHVESVAWVAGLTDPLVALFLLGTFLAYRRYTDTGRPAFALLALACYAAGLLSKEVAVFFPLLLVLHDGLRRQLRLARYLPYLVLVAGYFIARAAALGQGLDWVRFDLGHWPVLLEFVSRYSQLLMVPWPLEFYYYARPAANVPAVILGGAGLLAAAVYAWRAWRRGESTPLFALAWFAITLLPALPIALLDKPIFAIRALYLPAVGLALLVAWGYGKLRLRAVWNAALAGLVAVFSVVSFLEVADWRDNVTFYSRAAETSPRAPQPYSGLAETYERRGDFAKAVAFNLKAASLADREATRLDYLEKAAELAGQHGDTANSERYYQEILQHDPQRSSAWVGLGNNALARRDPQQALKFYHNAYQADPSNFIASYNLALVYRGLGDGQRAAYFENIARRLQAGR
jgi:tetratricopeptide (TPR) repeat protein